MIACLKHRFAKIDRNSYKHKEVLIPTFDPFSNLRLRWGTLEPIRLLTSPQVDIPYEDRQLAFARWYECLADGDVDDELPPEINAYVQRFGNHPAAMLYALGNESDGEFEIGRGRMIVKLKDTEPFGISGGKLVTVFGGPLFKRFTLRDWNPFPQKKLSNGDLAAIHRVAMHYKSAIKHAFYAYVHGNPQRRYDELFTRRSRGDIGFDHEEAEEFVYGAHDPYAELYIDLVPSRMDPEKFDKLFPRWRQLRKFALPEIEKLKLMEKLIHLTNLSKRI